MHKHSRCNRIFYGELTRTTRKKHTFLGMDFEFIGDSKVAISTPHYVEEVLDDFPETLKGNAVNPVKSKLFEITEDMELIDHDRKELFHSKVAKLLWMEKQSRPDLETAVSFLTTRIQKPTEEDWGKLRRVLNFLKSTKTDRHIIGSNDFLTLETWMNASHPVHWNMRRNTGGCMSLGKGVLHAKASKQKLNSKSSTETEVIAVSEYVPYKLQLIYFIEGQGYNIKRKVLYQDNQSAMRMEHNGRNLCTGNSRHISIRYFFVIILSDKILIGHNHKLIILVLMVLTALLIVKMIAVNSYPTPQINISRIRYYTTLFLRSTK
jgi:hypothetical protein